MGMRILLVEDEPGLVLTVDRDLKAENYEVETARDGEAGFQRALNSPFDLLILNVMLPRKNGFYICRELRQRGIRIPILMLTADDQVIDPVLGSTLGADDYLTKPFAAGELLARVKALLRSTRRSSSEPQDFYRFGDVEVDCRRAEVTRAGRPVELGAREYQLLCFLIRHRESVLSRNELLDRVWGFDAMPSARTVDVHVAWLRRKLEPNPRHPQFIQTVYGLGYRFLG